MRKNFLLPLVIVMSMPFVTRAEWIPLNNKSASPSAPAVTLISDDNNSTVIKFEISGFDLKDIVADGKNYQLANLLSESYTNKPGNPALSYLAKVLAIPDQSGVTVEILEMGEKQTFSNITLAPARESWLEGSPETPYTENADVYNSTVAYPGEYVKFDTPSIFRDFRITRVSVFPMQYLPGKKELQVVSSITVRINYGAGEAINPKTTAKKPIAPSFGKLYQEFIFNYESVLNKDIWRKGKRP